MPGKGLITVIALHLAPEIGAAAKRMQSFATALTRHGYRVRVITQFPNYPRGQIYPGYEKRILLNESQDGVHITRIWPLLLTRRSLIWRSLSEGWFTLMAFFCALSGPRPSMVLATCPSVFSPFAGWAASVIRRSRFVLEIRDLTWHYAGAVRAGSSPVGRVLEKAILWIARRAALVLCTNSYQQQYLLRNHILPDRCHIIPPGVDAELLQELARPHPRQSRMQVMYVGLVGHPQGLQVLVDTARLLANDPRYHVTIVGDGPERAALAALAEAQHVPNISFVGSVSADEVATFYRQADILVAHLRDNPAFYSALPSKLIEYMAAGKPIVYGGHGAGADLIATAGTGFVVKPESAEEMAAAIRRIADDPHLARQMGEKGQACVEAHYRREVVVDRLLIALEGLITDETIDLAGSAIGRDKAAARIPEYRMSEPVGRSDAPAAVGSASRARGRLPTR